MSSTSASAAEHRPRHARPDSVPAKTPSTPTAEDELRRMIGVSADCSREQVRVGYDLAVHRATRSGDHAHALRLSRAYDQLPAATRARLYPTSRANAVSPRPQGSGSGRSQRTLVARRRGARRTRAFWLRLVLYGLIAPLAVGIGTYVGAHRYQQQQSSDTQRLHQPGVFVTRPQPLPTAPRMPGNAPAVIVPVNASTGANGLVTLVCQPAPGAPGYLMSAPRGAVVRCTNGATPTVVG